MGMGDKPGPEYSLERINNNGNYDPGNVKWGTPTEQARNRRSNTYLTAKGETKLLIDWARELGTRPIRINKRLQMGWSVEDAVSIPIHAKGKKKGSLAFKET